MADLLKSGHDRPPRRWIGMAAAVVLLAGAGLYGALHESSDSLEPAPAPVSTESAAPPAISHRALGKPILGITGKWELFGRNVHSVVRVRPAKGLITRTTVPQSSGSGPVSFLVTGDRAIVRPFDRVDGFFVPDNGNAQRLKGAMRYGGPFLPGPTRNTLWIPDEESPWFMDLVTADGNSAHRRIQLPRPHGGFAQPDGAGYLLLTDLDGVLDYRPGQVGRITKDTLLAAGPTRWLTAACHHGPRCRLTVINRVTGKRRSLGNFPGSTAGGTTSPANSMTGIISADSASAALISADGLHLLSLRTGTDTLINVPLDPSTIQTGTIVWSPASRWLFVAGDGGKVYAIDAHSGSVHYLEQIPPVTQLAIRTTAGA